MNIFRFIRSGFILCTVLFTSTASARDFNILDFGATADTSVLSTDAFTKAIEACHKAGGGRVIVPSGRFKSGTILLLDNVELHLERGAVLFASTAHVDFPRQPQPAYRSQKDPGGWYALIYAVNASHIAITGAGTIDGQGRSQLSRTNPGKFVDDDKDGRPRNVLFISCKDILIRDITMLNSGIWNQHYLDCERVRIENINVYNHSNRNNDALDIDGCRDVIVSNSVFDSDDDGIVLKSTGIAPCENIVISNCIVSSYCSAIKCGTESTGGFRNILITDCIVRPSTSKEPPVFDHGRKTGQVGIALEIVDGGTMDGVTVSDLIIEGTDCPLFVRLANRARKHIEEAREPSAGKMRNISISNIRAYNTGTQGCSITGVPEARIENIRLSNIQISSEGGLARGSYLQNLSLVPEAEKSFPSPNALGVLPCYGLFIRHVEDISLSGITFKTMKPEQRHAIIADDVSDLRIEQLVTDPGARVKPVLVNRVKKYHHGK